MDGKTEVLLKIREGEEKARKMIEESREKALEMVREAREKALELERQAVEEVLEEQRELLGRARKKLDVAPEGGDAKKLRERAEKRLGRAVQLVWKEFEE